MSDGDGQTKNLGAIVTQLASSGVLFAAALFLLGFLVLREYYNYLGLPVDLATSYADYLAMGVRLIVASLLSLTFVIICTIPLAVLMVLAWSHESTHDGVVRMWASLHRHLHRPSALLFANGVALVMLAFGLLLSLNVADHADLLFKEHPPLSYNAWNVPRFRYVMLELACILSLAVSWVLASKVNGKIRGGRLFTTMLAILTGSQLVLLPINYGALEVPTEFPKVLEIDKNSVTGAFYLLGSDVRGNRILYDRKRRQVILAPDTSRLVLGKREDVLQDRPQP